MHIDRLKILKLKTKALLWRANWNRDYVADLILSEQSHALLYHLFGLGYTLKIFGQFKHIRSDFQLEPCIALLQGLQYKLKTTLLPHTSLQQHYHSVKQKTVANILHILHSLQGLQGKPHDMRRLRAMFRRSGLNAYFKYQEERGLKYQI